MKITAQDYPIFEQQLRKLPGARYDADVVAPFIYQRAARIARLHRRADLKMARVILNARQRRDFPLGQHGRKPTQTDVGKTDGRHRPAQLRCAARGNGQRRKFPVRLQQSQIIGRVHTLLLPHFTIFIGKGHNHVDAVGFRPAHSNEIVFGESGRTGRLLPTLCRDAFRYWACLSIGFKFDRTVVRHEERAPSLKAICWGMCLREQRTQC